MVHDRRTHDPAFWIHRNVDCDYSSAYVTLKTSSPDLRGVGMTFTIGRGNDIVRSNSSLCWGMHKRPLRHRFAKRSTTWRIVLLVRKSRTSSQIWARHGHTLPQIHNSAGTKSLLPRPPRPRIHKNLRSLLPGLVPKRVSSTSPPVPLEMPSGICLPDPGRNRCGNSLWI